MYSAQLVTGFAILYRLRHANPNIKQAKAGDDASDWAQAEDGPKAGVRGEKEVVVPDRGPPGQDGDDDAQVDAEDDQDEEAKAKKPRGCGPVRGGVGGRGRAGKQVVLNGHRLKVLRLPDSQGSRGGRLQSWRSVL